MHLSSPLASDAELAGAAPVSVLLVDDRPENLLALEAILEPLGETLVLASSGQEALDQLVSKDFALVLLDVSMPEMDGFETARRIKARQNSAETPIIFLTANLPDERLILQGYEVGAVDYLFKPLSPEVVRSKVTVFCDLYRSRERERAQAEKQRAQQMLQESERRLRSLVEATAAAVWKTNANGEIEAEENDWRLLTGQSFAEMKGTGWLNAIHPGDRQRTEIAWRKALAGGMVYEIEHRVRTPTGEYREMFARAVPVFDATGLIEEWVGTHTDITARKYAERQRDLALDDALRARETAERALEEAEIANRGKSEFLATMSHEFRTPLNAILGYTQIIDLGVLGKITSQQHDHLERLRSSAVHLLGLVNDILDLSKIEAGRVKISRETALVSEAIRATMSLVGPQAVARGIESPEECEGDAGIIYVGDSDRVRQILVNLISNAVKFTNPGGSVRLHCGSATHGDPGARLVGSGPWTFIRVVDTGIGIPEEQLVRIFEPFVQAESGYTRTEGGTGLGLAISRRLARLMRGDITVQSEVGGGSTFTLWLPGGSAGRTSTPTTEYPAFHDTPQEVDAAAVQFLAAAIKGKIDDISQRYVDRLRKQVQVPDLFAVGEPYLRDHADTVITEILTAARLLAETKGRATDLLRDASDIQRLLAELHGGQRFRLGWSEAEIARDVDMLAAELISTTRSLSGGDSATAFVVDVIRKILDQWKLTSIRGYRFALAAGKR